MRIGWKWCRQITRFGECCPSHPGLRIQDAFPGYRLPQRLAHKKQLCVAQSAHGTMTAIECRISDVTARPESRRPAQAEPCEAKLYEAPILCPTTTSAPPLSRHIFDFEPSTKPLATKFKTGHPGSNPT
jgi:hypothetical protein